MKKFCIASLCISLLLLLSCVLNLPDPIGEDMEKFMPHIKYAKHSIYFDSSQVSRDEVISKGDTIGLQVWLKNIGLSGADYVKATFSTTSEYVEKLTPTTEVKYGNIPAESFKMVSRDGYSSKQSGYTIQFVVSDTTPTDTQIPICIDIAGATDRTWKDTFNITVF
ncbi:MAG: hypothetical protein LBL94_04695 [Prevotellaceae bacterium]|jgi:hypothetical protein|nr:hypothetical protein [Prevotellaceae bacterium]